MKKKKMRFHLVIDKKFRKGILFGKFPTEERACDYAERVMGWFSYRSRVIDTKKRNKVVYDIGVTNG